MRHVVSSLAALFLASVALASPAAAQNICTFVDANGVKVSCSNANPLPVTGGTGGGGSGTSGGTATAANPTYTEGAAAQPFSLDLTGYQRVRAKQDGTWSFTINGGSIGNTTFASTQGGTWNVGLSAGSALVGKFGIDQTTPGTTDSVTVKAGENHTGEVGGNQLTIQVAQTVTASAYTSGNAVGGLMTLSNAARVSAGSGLLQSVVISSKSAQTTQVDVFIFSANPTGTTCTDKTAFALASADFDKVLGVASVTTWFSGGTPSIGQSQNLAMPFALASGTTLYACAVTRSTPTYASTSDVSVGFRVLRN